jgi:hypothetical protein
MVQDESGILIKPEKLEAPFVTIYTVKLLTKLFDVATLTMNNFLIDYVYIILLVQLQEKCNFLISDIKMNKTNLTFE